MVLYHVIYYCTNYSLYFIPLILTHHHHIVKLSTNTNVHFVFTYWYLPEYEKMNTNHEEFVALLFVADI